MLALLLRQRWQSFRNEVQFSSRLHRLIGSGFALGSLALFVGIVFVFGAILQTTEAVAGRELQASILSRTILYLFLFLFAGGVPFVSGVLLTPGDLPLLAGAPLKPSVIVAARLVDAVIAASGQFVVIGVPLLVAAGWASHVPWWGVLPFVVLVLCFLILPALAVALLLLTFARLVSVRRVKAAVAVTSAVLSLVMCLLTVSEFSAQASQKASAGDTGKTFQRFGMTIRTNHLPPPPPKWLPSTWFSDTITALGSETPSKAAAPFCLILLSTVVVGAGCIVLGGPVLVGETLLEGDSSGRTGNGEPALLDRILSVLPLSTTVQAILAKDARYIARDLVLLSQIGIPVILYFVPFVIARQAMAQSLASAQDLLFLSLGVVGTIVYMETSILGLSSVGLEGRAFWLTLSAPVSAGTFIRAKFLSAFVPSLALCGPMLLFSCLFFGASLRDALLGLVVLLVVCATLCGFGVGLSGLFPRFVYDNPAHRASLTALVWGFVGATAYVIIAGIALGGGWYLSGQWHEIAGTILGIGAGVFVIISLVAGFLPLLGAKARLTGYAWEE